MSVITRLPVRPVPSPRGLEHLRVMRCAASYPNEVVWRLYQRYGPVFSFGFGPVRFIWLVGEEAGRLIYQERPKDFTLRRAYSFLHPITGDTALITSDGEAHRERRKLVQPAFYPKRLDAAFTVVAAHAKRLADDLATAKNVDFHREVRPRVLAASCEILLGQATLNRYPHLVDAVAAMMDFANLPFLAQQLKLALPGTSWRRFVRARRAADAMLYGEIARRRQGLSVPRDDVLSMLLEAKDEEGRGLSEREIRDQSLSLLSAGFDTTSATLSWIIYTLLSRPELYAGLYQHLEVTAGRLEPQHLKALPQLDWLLKETLRLYPAAPAALRRAETEIAFQGYTIAKGSLVAFSIYATHRLAHLYHDPLSFKPERWGPLGGNQPSPYAYLPFGGGTRYCIGAGLASLMIKVFVVTLLQRLKLEPAWTRPVAETGNTVQPRGGLPVTVTPLTD